MEPVLIGPAPLTNHITTCLKTRHIETGPRSSLGGFRDQRAYLSTGPKATIFLWLTNFGYGLSKDKGMSRIL